VKNEKLAFLSDNTKYTLRFAMQIGGLCRAMTITDVARRMHLDWHTVKELDKLYMREQLARAGEPRDQEPEGDRAQQIAETEGGREIGQGERPVDRVEHRVIPPGREGQTSQTYS